jgi:serine protease AprX
MLALLAVNLITEGVLTVYDPELSERHEKFKQISGFDNVTTSGSGVDVCIVDTGFDASHPDLAHVELAGWQDFVLNRAEPYDDQGHGTAMAGILVAKNLLPGIAPNVNLYIAKAISNSGTGTDSDIAAAVDWCVSNDVDIISLSLGGSQGFDFILIETDELETAVNNAIDQGIFVVAAAGNDGGPDDDGDVSSPASEEDVICVGAIDTDGSIWSNSSVGNNGFNPPENWNLLGRQDPDKKPELVAPGEKIPILNAQIGGTNTLYAFGSGTSGATVWVSGAIAHLLEHRPDLGHNGSSGGNRQTVEDVKQWIRNSVVPQDGQTDHDEYYGYGRLRVDNLLSMAS